MNQPLRTGAARGVPLSRAQSLLLTTALASVAAGLFVPAVALAADECGAAQQGVVTCSETGNPYSDGIEYVTPAVDPTQDPGLDPAAPVYDLTINLDPGVAVERADGAGVALIGFNNGAVTLNAGSGASIAVTGTGSIGVLASTSAGDITINTSSLTATGRASSGINANSYSGDITIDAGTVQVTGDGGLGISAGSYAGDVVIRAGSIGATGYYAGGVNAYVGNGDLVLVADSVTTGGGSVYGIGSDAVVLTAVGGDITVALGTASTEAAYSTGVRAVSYGAEGGVSVTLGAVETQGFGSTAVLMQGGGVALDAGAITTSGDYGYGAVMFGVGDGGATLNAGAISTEGANATAAIVKTYYGGAATVTIGAVETQGAGSRGVYAYSDAGAVDVTVGQVSTAGDQAAGIVAIGGGAVTISGDQVTTLGEAATGIYALGQGDVTIDAGEVSVSGVKANAVAGVSYSGDVAINVDNASAAGGYAAAVAGVTLGAGDVVIVSDGAIQTQGDYAIGAFAVARGGGAASVTVNDVSTAGFGSHAIYALGDDATVTINGDVATAGYISPGVVAQAVDGRATVVNNGSISTQAGGGTGIFAYGSDGVSISGPGTIVTRGGGASGIVANGYSGDTTVIASSVTTSGPYSRGIQAQGSGNVTVDVGDVSTSGRIGTAIEAATFQNGTGPLDADLIVRADSITVSGDYSHGVNAFSSNDGVVSIDVGTVAISGIDGIGILSASFTADTVINVDTVITMGAGDAYNGPFGINATSDTGDITVTSTDLISTQGLNGSGVFAVTTGAVTVRVSDVETLGDNAAALALSGGDVDVTISGEVSAVGADAVVISSVDGATVDNAGVIRSGSGYALNITGDAASITNTGEIVGRLRLTDDDDTLVNSGRLTPSGASDFGAGDDTLRNSGVIQLISATTPQTASVTGLETLVNSGSIDLRNGVAGDRLSFDGAAYQGSGDGGLGLDLLIANGAATADTVAFGSAAGTSRISLNTTGAATLFAPVTLVEVDAASASTAFVLDDGSRERGLIALNLSYSSQLGAYQLISAPGSAVYRQAQLGEAITTLWNRSADAVSARFAANRDAAWATGAGADFGRVWFQALAETNTRKNRSDQDPADIDIGYKQDTAGLQVGFDLVGRPGDDGLIAGLTAGYITSTTRFEAVVGDRFDVEAFNVGGFAGYRSRALFIDALAKYDRYAIDRQSYVAAIDREDDAQTLGAKVEAGIRLGSPAFFAEPLVSLAYSRSSLDDFAVGPNALDYDRFDGLRGKAGLRIGGRADIAGSSVAYYAGAAVVREFEGEGGLVFVSGGQSVVVQADRLGTFGQATVGVNATMSNGVTGFVEWQGDFGGSYRGAGIRAGLRLRF